MRKLRKHLTYANLASTLAVFLLLAGGTAFAASQLGKNSVGSKQLKKNAVTAAKIKKSAVTGAKIKNGAVGAAKLAGGAVGASQLADGSVTGAKINAASTPFSRVVGTLRQTISVPFSGPLTYPIGTYTQPVGETDVFVPSMDVTFAASCVAPRVAQAFLLVNPENPSSPTPFEIVGLAIVEDKGSGEVKRRVTFNAGSPGLAPLNYGSPLAPTPRTFFVQILASGCSSGSGIQLSGASVEVIGTPSP